MHTLSPIVFDTVNQSTVLKVIDEGTGIPDQAVTDSSFAMWYRREVLGGDTPLTFSGSHTGQVLAALTTAHTDWGVEHIEEGAYRVDCADACFAVGAIGVTIGAVVTGKIVIESYHEIIYPNGIIHGLVDAGGTHSTTTCYTDVDGFATSELINRVIVFTVGTAAPCAAKITAYNPTNGQISFSGAITTTPVNTDRFVIV